MQGSIVHMYANSTDTFITAAGCSAGRLRPAGRTDVLAAQSTVRDHIGLFTAICCILTPFCGEHRRFMFLVTQ